LKYHFELAFSIRQNFKLLCMFLGRNLNSEPQEKVYSVIDGLKYIIYPYMKLA
jgi:hypothetical protein